MKKLQGQEFTNSDACHGVSFTSDAPVDLAEIVITGRYPESGWARNKESHEVVRVLHGKGSLAIRGYLETELTEGDVVHIPPGDWFAWDGCMKLLMTCSPPFSSGQYEVEEEKDGCFERREGSGEVLTECGVTEGGDNEV